MARGKVTIYCDNDIYKRECEAVKRLGEQIGYGNMMDIASTLWAKELVENEIPDSAAFYPTIFSEIKEGKLKNSLKNRRNKLIRLYTEWGL